MSVFLLEFEYFIEKKFHLSTRVWISILGVLKFFPRGQTFGAKKYCHVGTLEAFHLLSLDTSMKAKRLTSCYPPIKLLGFLHLSTHGHSVKILLSS